MKPIHLHKTLTIVILSCILAASSCSRKTTEAPLNIRCNYKINPLGIDTPAPSFFWEIPSTTRGTMQSAFQLLIASRQDILNEKDADMWNSGKVASIRNIQVRYNGKALQSSTRYYWKVKFWDQQGNSSGYSEEGWFETGLLSPADWKAEWIYNGTDAPENEAEMYKDSPAPIFRKDFQAQKEIKSARLTIAGLGYYEAFLNGLKIGSDMLNPGWTDYSRRIQYNTYDVTSMLSGGPNTIGVLLGNGWYNPLPLYLFNRLNLRNVLTIGQPKFIAQLRIEFSDGSETIVATDTTWKTGDSPILRNNVYLGEKYDARLEQDGWNIPGFYATGWKDAMLADSPGGRLVAQIQEPVRVTREVKPASFWEVSPGVYIFDMGQNFAGCARLKVSGAAGTRIQMRYGELLFNDSTLNDRSTIACHIMKGSYVTQRPGAPENADQRDIYITRGKGEEVYHSRFTFHGFRYVELTGFPGKPDITTLTGLRMNSDLNSSGSFECSNELFNQIQENTLWTLLSNVFSIESDCPGREKFGYGGDIVTASETYIDNFDMSSFYTKVVRDFQDEQDTDGGMPECAPDNNIYDAGLTENTGPIGWMIAHPFLLDKLLNYYGDSALVREQYESFKKLTDFITSHAEHTMIDQGIGDHATIAPKDLPVSGTAFYYYCAEKLSEFAGLLNIPKDQEHYSSLAGSIKESFTDSFINKETGAVGKGTQADQSFALYFDLVPDELKNKVLQYLIDDIRLKRDYHLSTGIFGTKFLFNVLKTYGKDSLAYVINTQRTSPSYGNMIEDGATTILESWHGRGSQNHPMFGSVSEWFYKAQGGISPAPDAMGFDKIIIAPSFFDGLDWVKAEYKSVMGPIRCSWEKKAGLVSMEVSIPGNTMASVHFPVSDPDKITESGKRVKASRTMKVVSAGPEEIVLSVGPGVYRFEFNTDMNGK